MSAADIPLIVSADPMVWVSLCVGGGAMILAVVILFVIAGVQQATIARQQRSEQFREVWFRLLIKSMMTAPDELPPVRSRDAKDFLRLWNYLSESIRGGDRNGLHATMRLAGMDRVAAKMLKSYRLDDRLMAVVALGHLRERTVWNALERFVVSRTPELSLAAARSLIRIDAQAALAILIPLVGVRTDWSFVKVATMLSEADLGQVVEALAHEARGASVDATVRFLRCLEAVGSPDALPVVREILARENCDNQVVVACLRCCSRYATRQDLGTVRAYLAHPNHLIRLHAVLALGRIGTEEDERLLIDRLSDDEWWVRYRAAGVLAGFPFVSSDTLARLHAEHPLQEVRDVLAPFVARRAQRVMQTTNG
ncbi:MAG: HEAT repeat domain-containing protein [Nitrospira sp.]|nr:HEAT repeat domain-containing protein [Nitrospira sp.]